MIESKFKMLGDESKFKMLGDQLLLSANTTPRTWVHD